MKKELDKELYPDYVYPEFTPDPNEPFREPIAKLGKKITDRIPQKLGLKKITRNDPEYWGLAGVLTDEEAELAVKLGVRKPKTLAEIVKLSGLEEKKCEALLEEMSRKGLLESEARKTVCATDVCTGMCRIFQHERKHPGL